MANGKKTYEIVINGIQQSVDAVESLNKQLDALEKRIDALAKKNVSVSASGGGSNKSALDEEAKILQHLKNKNIRNFFMQRRNLRNTKQLQKPLQHNQILTKVLTIPIQWLV